MNFFRQLAIKPWIESPDDPVNTQEGVEFPLLAQAAVGLRILLAVLTVFFSLVIITYADRMTTTAWQPVAEPALLWWNTGILFVSSIALHWAAISAKKGRDNNLKSGMLAGGAFAVVFLVGQVLVWRQLDASGFFFESGPATAYFYLVTALHALHVLGGLVAWGRTMAKLGHNIEPKKLQLSVELCAFYWHFLLIVWLVLFSLLLFT